MGFGWTWLEWAILGIPLVATAFVLRVAVHTDREPGGVDAWYYLAWADAFRRRPSLHVRLPQYLLQDEVQSYPPLFPMLLAALPRSFARRWFWVISPSLDCLHLLLLYALAFKLTASLTVSALTALVYAFTPHLVSEFRALTSRSLAALLHSVAMVMELRYAFTGEAWPWLPLALLSGVAIFLTSATGSSGYGFVSLVLTVFFGDPRYLAVAVASLLLTFLVTGGFYARVVMNYVHAVLYWVRNRGRFGADPIRHSPVFGREAHAPAAARPGFLGLNTASQLVRLVGENPFLLALPLANVKGIAPWGYPFFVWASALAFLAAGAIILPPLRAFGPGRSYLKATVFPTAFCLAVGIGSMARITGSNVGRATMAGLLASAAAIAFFWMYTRGRDTERTSSVPAGLREAADALRELPAGAVLCLPYMYADYTCYHAEKPILWGGHSGDLRRLEVVTPVLAHPLAELRERFGLRYVLLDRLFVTADVLRLDGGARIGSWDSFELFDLARPEARAS